MSHLDKLFRGLEHTIPTLTATDRDKLMIGVQSIREMETDKEKTNALISLLHKRLYKDHESKSMFLLDKNTLVLLGDPKDRLFTKEVFKANK